MGFDKAKTINAAEKYIAQGKIAQAVQEYAKVVEREPNDFTSVNMLGDLYARLKKPDEAVAHFLRVAEHYREQGFTLKAVAMFKKIQRLGVPAPGVGRKLAALYEQQGLYVEAREQYLQIAEEAQRAGQTRDALEALRRIADFDPRNVEIRLRLAQGCAAQEGMAREASDAYVEAGELLLARNEARKALDCYKRAHEINPASHAVLRGLVAACAALGEAEEAAHVLEHALTERPGDLELRAMLARAYVDAEDATAAERATEALVAADATNFPLLFEVARLYLRRSYVNEAVRVLSRAVEPALSGRQEAALLEILSEALARDPEHIEALKLLLRIYTWQRDDERMRVTLERLAEAAQTHGLADEERRALEHLVRLVPFDQSYHERLEALGVAADGGARAGGFAGLGEAYDIPAPGDAHAAGGHSLYDFDPFAAATAETSGQTAAAFEFEWNTVTASAAPPPQPAAPAAPPQSATADPSASFADLNEEFADPSPAARAASASHLPAGQTAFGEPATPSNGAAAAIPAHEAVEPTAGDGRTEALLRQELESVDFYLEQGYADIARDTLDMLERQFGANPEIAARRAHLGGDAEPHAGSTVTPSESQRAAAEPSPPTITVASHLEETITFDDFAAFDFDAAPAAVEPTPAQPEPTAAPQDHVAPAAKPPSPNGNGRPVSIDPGLAAVFDEFRESVEGDGEGEPEEDYETCYNLGLAYREMGLLDEAVEQFQRAAHAAAGDASPTRPLQCCNMLGHCFMQKGLPRPAALWFERALKLPDLSDDERQALRYDLATSYEQMGDVDRAIDTFSEIYGLDVSYRGVSERLRDLQSLKAVS